MKQDENNGQGGQNHVFLCTVCTQWKQWTQWTVFSLICVLCGHNGRCDTLWTALTDDFESVSQRNIRIALPGATLVQPGRNTVDTMDFVDTS